jgi:hypothetical protein
MPGSHSGPLEVLYYLTPVMAVTVMLMSLLVEQLWTVLPGSPYFANGAAMVLSVGLMMVRA